MLVPNYMKHNTLTFLICIAIFFGCHQADQFEPMQSDSMKQAILTSDQETSDDEPVINKQVRKIIKEANIRIEVAAYSEAMGQLSKLVEEHDAYIANEQERRTDVSLSNDVLIRVPNEQFEALMTAIAEVAEEVNYKQVSAKDVTEQFVDVQARLKSKRAVETRYIELLQQARNVEELLKVEEHLRVIREEIEATEGKLRYLNDQIAYSSIQLHLSQPLTRLSDSFLATIGKAFKGGWDGLLGFLVGMVYIWPIFLLIVGWFVYIKRTGRSFWGRKGGGNL